MVFYSQFDLISDGLAELVNLAQFLSLMLTKPTRLFNRDNSVTNKSTKRMQILMRKAELVEKKSTNGAGQ
jgi:hypothetical protein